LVTADLTIFKWFICALRVDFYDYIIFQILI
jgi:hypothetical protein